MKKSLIILLSTLSIASFAETSSKLECNLKQFGMTRIKAFIDLDRGEILTALPGESISEATDEYQIRLKEHKGSIFVFNTDNPEYNPEDLAVTLNNRNLTIKARVVHEGFAFNLSGTCKKR